MNQSSTCLVGLDVGFAQNRRTNAIAELIGDHLSVRVLSVDERNAALRSLPSGTLIAIDAPLLPELCDVRAVRAVERIFSRGLFQRRCKPGMSHIPGTGLLLRCHGAYCAAAVTGATRSTAQLPFDAVMPGHAIVEAFPNAFLGVVLDDDVYESAPRIRRGGKFDWLYDQWRNRGLFDSTADAWGLPGVVAARINAETNHDSRAALVCLLTATVAAQGTAACIGDASTGYFFLPPLESWANWARETVAVATR